MSLSSLLRPLKHALLGRETRPRRIRFGAARGLVMDIDPNAKTQRLLGLDEREIQALFVATARWSEVLVDIGASDGYYGLIYHRHQPAGEVILIDGDANFAAVQERHFALNFPDFMPQQVSRFVAPADRQNENTCCVASDFDLGGRRVFFKIDVDGWELDVVRSIAPLLPETEMRFIIETHSVQLERDCVAFLQEAGFETRIIDNAWWRRFVPEQRPLELNRWLYAARPSAS